MRLFDQRDGAAAVRQMIGGAAADDPAPTTVTSLPLWRVAGSTTE
jgi:hypothetical protein